MTDTSVYQATAAPHEAYTNRYRYYVLALLTLGYVFNFVDRQVMTILIEPIKMEFGASDTQMGLLSGLAFALFYATLGIPVARLADRWSRRNVLAISMTTWSAVTALCATATGFWHLLLLRIGVGIGEAGGTPPSQSLLADYFPPEKRAFAQGILATAPNIGILVGLFGGALIAEAYGWRSVFLVFGIPGILLAILIQLTIKEPLKVTASASEEGAGLFSTLGNIFRLPSFAHIMVGVGFTGIAGYGLGVWSPSFLVRVHNMSLVDAGLYLGLIGVFGGGLGTISSGLLVDRLARRDKRWQLWLPAIGIFLALPTQLAFLLWPAEHRLVMGDVDVPFALVFMALSAVFASFWIAPSYAAVQNLVPQYWRTQASALMLLAINLLGMGLGPLLVGMLSDLLSQFGDSSVRYGLSIGVSLSLVGGIAYLRGSTLYARAVENKG
ncbi:MFS transporter [Candidatus Paraluminiphilus aquimaris]|uniref:MFS transporter n=1 Tax=Candidatus Paraluminiphilus aquimaris TaxID=2518994 RepID=A0ABY6Q9A6_9GAMM|nr:MFS transporter [Candidatus Paraluminiphilus aquimaris]UZP75140.1 MFS transporter [Candidatus Paraluminiphilus aquimaris]